MLEKQVKFEDLVRASDVIMSKPSYGIISECIANRVRFIYSDRADFIEAEPLISGIRQYLPHAVIPKDELFKGLWKPFLEKVLDSKFPENQPSCNGSEEASEALEQYLK